MEGDRFVLEVLRSEDPIESIVISEEASRLLADEIFALSEERGVPLFSVDDSIFRWLSELVTPSSTLAVCKIKFLQEADLRAFDTVLALDGVQDPGNLGTILRSVAAVGSVACLLGEGTADPFSPKVVRASASLIRTVPLFQSTSLASSLSLLKTAGYEIVGLTADVPQSLWSVQLPPRRIFVVGSEGGGLSQAALELVDIHVAIPMAEIVESLNVGVSASVLLFEVLRRRLSDVNS